MSEWFFSYDRAEHMVCPACLSEDTATVMKFLKDHATPHFCCPACDARIGAELMGELLEPGFSQLAPQ